MEKKKHDRRKNSIRGKIPNFFITGSFLMSLVITLLVGYNQLQQRFQTERWIASEKQDVRIEKKIDDLSETINKRIESDAKKIEEHSNKIAILWQRFKDKILEDSKKN